MDRIINWPEYTNAEIGTIIDDLNVSNYRVDAIEANIESTEQCNYVDEKQDGRTRRKCRSISRRNSTKFVRKII